MSPYDMPEALSVLQSYDMTAIGFVQDLLHGNEKIVRKLQDKQSVVVNIPMGDGTALIKRGYISLADKEWSAASDYGYESWLKELS